MKSIKSKKYKRKSLIFLAVLTIATMGVLFYYVLMAQAFTGNDGIVLYGYGNRNNSTRGRTYDNRYTNATPDGISSRTTGTSTASSPIQFFVAKRAPTRAETMIGHVKTSGRLDLITCTTGCNNGGDFTNQWNTTIFATLTNSTVSRGFDVAYEQLSGRAMVVYAGNTTGKLYYCLYDGTSWGPVSNCAPTNGVNDITLTDGTTTLTGTPRWVKLAAYGTQFGDYRSNQILLATEDSNSDVLVTKWDGSSWSTTDRQVVTTTGGANLIAQSFDIGWESVSGAEMIVYANGSTLAYRTSTGSGWSAASNVQTSSPGTVKWAQVASDSKSNRMSLIITFGATTNRVYVWKTDGSTAGWTAGSTDLTAETDTGENVSTAWEKANSGTPEAMFIGTASNALIPSYRTWTQAGGFTSWTTTSGNSADDMNSHSLIPSPNSDEMVDVSDDIDARLRMRAWGGSAWRSLMATGNLPTTLSATTANSDITNTNHTQHSFDFVYKPYAAWSKNWQWFDDQSTAGNPTISLANEGVTATAKPNNTMRLRMNIAEKGNQGQNDTRKKLQYSSGAGCPDSTTCTWTDVGAQGSGSIWRYADGGLIDDDIIPSTILDGSNDSGNVVENGTAAAPNSDQGAQNTREYDFTIHNNGSTIGTIYYFRAYDYGASESGGSLTNLNAILREQDIDVSGAATTNCMADGVAAACTYPSLFSYTSSPHRPIFYFPVDGNTKVSTVPVIQLRSNDDEADNIQYVIEWCPTNSWPCPSGGGSFDQTSSQTSWNGQDADSGTTYVGRTKEPNSTMGQYSVSAGIFAGNTTYYLRAKAIDPFGSNTYSLYSDIVGFTTAPLEVLIRGGTCIGGVGSSCTSGSGSFTVKIAN